VITQPDDAQKVIDFAKSRGVGRLGFWALARDNGACAKKVKAQPDCSGIAQKDWQFTQHSRASRSDVRVGRARDAAVHRGWTCRPSCAQPQGCRSVAARTDPSGPISMWNGVDSW